MPTLENVTAECDRFDQEYWLAEEAVRLLWQRFDRNFEIRHVLLKVLVLNKLYGTMIPDDKVETLAKHIVGLAVDKHLDTLLDRGELEAVALIRDCPNLKQYASFASKFCSWHHPTDYPIYDGNVRACLWSYQEQDSFTTQFLQDDLSYYLKYVDIIKAFRTHYKLDSLTFKQLDKFMYRLGGRILKARKDLKNGAIAT